jgi:hypothetical protein
MSNKTVRSIEQGAFRVEFVPSGDRIAHVIYVREPLGAGAPETQDFAERPWIELLRSVESEADVAWPDSPPLQELHIEDRGGVPVALLVGRAGKSHWSASIGFEGDPGLAAGNRFKLIVDVACLARSEPMRLGSVYSLARDVDAANGNSANCEPNESNASGQERAIVLSGRDGLQVQLSTIHPFPIDVTALGRRLDFQPSVNLSTLPTTVRWGFSLARDDG